MTRHLLEANCKTVQLGGFSPKLEPALTVDSIAPISKPIQDMMLLTMYSRNFLPRNCLDICQNLPPNRKVGTRRRRS
ncbi:hypothetical protein [Microcoleus sp. B4-D4]|uniref:hypothetical protein n=1 Tax=Microcoleus sp. B4-D4 TaxID=2818667 RepID=UPI002FD6C3B2